MGESCEFEECPRYEEILEIKEALKVIELDEARQKSDIKSIHKRMDADAIVRAETHDAVLKQSINLSHHMDWEEEQAQVKDKQKALYMWAAGFVFVVFMAITQVLFSAVYDNTYNNTVISKDVTTLIETVNKSVKEQKAFNEQIRIHTNATNVHDALVDSKLEAISNKYNHLDALVNRKYGYTKGSSNADTAD